MKNLFEIGKQLVGEIMTTAQSAASAAKKAIENTGESNTQQVQVTEQDKRELAYHLWEKAGCPSGDGQEFWFKAESALEDQPSEEATETTETTAATA